MPPSRTCTRRSLPIPINMVHLFSRGGAWKHRGDFDRMNRDRLIDILIEARSLQDEQFFRSLCADWMRTRVIDRCTGEFREWRNRPNLKSRLFPVLMANLDWLTLGTDSEKKFPIANYLTRWIGGGPSNSKTKSMLSQQSSRGAPPSEIETSTLYRLGKKPFYRVPNQRFFKYPIR